MGSNRMFSRPTRVRKSLFILGLTCCLANKACPAPPALTIYNQNFAVVRDTVPLDLKAGSNEVRFANATAELEPDSVVLRDPAGRHSLQVVEQNYRNDPVTQQLLLSLFQGKTIEFETVSSQDSHAVRERVAGKIVRSGSGSGLYDPYGQYPGDQPIIEVNGKLQFSLPGQPLFPDLGDDTILKPALDWTIQSDAAGKFDAEVSYLTGGLTWEADYNLIAPETGDLVNLIGWVTLRNECGRTFENAKIKLMAGDVHKLRHRPLARGSSGGAYLGGGGGPPVVDEKGFDEYHLYTLGRATTLRDRQTKQVEFVRTEQVFARTIYIYDGAAAECRFAGGLNSDQNYGAQSNKKVWVAREFMNAATNHLGIALPRGKLRLYRRNDDGQSEFTGEDEIDHTPRNELVRVKAGNAFDLVGERKQTDFKIQLPNPPVAAGVGPDGLPLPAIPPAAPNIRSAETEPPPWMNESFEITLRNHKRQPVEIRVVEHLYRWSNWEIRAPSVPFAKTDAQTIEFRLSLDPEGEKAITYTVHYSW